jgi:hypothetical protein
MSKQTFKIEIKVQTDSYIHSEDLKDSLQKQLTRLQPVEDNEGRDVSIETVDYWKTAKVRETECQ